MSSGFFSEREDYSVIQCTSFKSLVTCCLAMERLKKHNFQSKLVSPTFLLCSIEYITVDRLKNAKISELYTKLVSETISTC